MKSAKPKNLLFLTFICLLAITGCNAKEFQPEDMESTDQLFLDRQRQGTVFYMSLNTMFVHPQVRSLAKAAGEGDLQKVDELVALGVDVNASGASGATPLFWALRSSNFEGFVRLLEVGADPNVVFADGSVMHWSARHEDDAFLRAALNHGGDSNLVAGQLGETPLFATIGLTGNDRPVTRRLLLDSGADIDATTSGFLFGRPMGGKTAAMAAADLGRFDIVIELLEAGANPLIVDVHGRNLVSQVQSMQNAFESGSAQERDFQYVKALLDQD